MLAYTLLRALLFAAVAVVLYLAGARGLLLLALAVLLSGFLSLVLLARHRDAMSSALVARGARMRARFDRGAASEDE